MKAQMEIEQSADKLTISLPAKKPSKFSSGDEWRTKQLVALAEVFKELLTPQCIAMYVESLADLSDDQIRHCIERAVRELEWFPKPSKLRELADAEGSAASQDAEIRAAWETVTRFCSKYVSNDVHGNYGPEHGWYRNPPRLSDRILDTVRRSGGWRIYACMTDEDFPFVQKRFFEEYQAWAAVEHVDPSKLLTERPLLHLVAKSMDIPKSEPDPAPMARKIEVKRVPELPTPEQMRDQAAVQKQALVDWESRRQRKRSEGRA
jgi:hypothetical protein